MKDTYRSYTMVFAKTSEKGKSMCHHHLTLEERELTMKYQAMGYSISRIAILLHRNKSTVSRELKRNSVNGIYLPSAAQKAYLKRRKACRPRHKLDDPVLYRYVKDRFLLDQWSPQQIEGRLILEKAASLISYSTIYRAIYSGRFDDLRLSHGSRGVIRKLRRRGKSRHTRGYKENRGKIQISYEISERPQEAEDRSRLGDWEADTVAGKTGRSCLVTLVDRKSRFLIGGKASLKKAAPVNEVMIGALADQPLESITPDRGKEFARHKEVSEALDQVKFYFPLPHHPWQRGSNENTNGLLREYFPKGETLDDKSDELIQEIFDKINKRPRKCLGYRAPYEVHYSTELRLI